jgi:hypothetical protein
MCKNFFALAVFLDGDFPLASDFLPHCFDDTSVELDVPVKIPLLGGPDDVILDFGTTGIEMRPLWIWIERKCLPLVSARSKKQENYLLELTYMCEGTSH